MKNVFVLSLALIFGFALVMGCANMQTKDANEKEALTMGKGGTKKLKLKVKKEGGQIVDVTDINNIPGTPVTQAQLDQIYQNNGFTHVGVVLYAESSPGCYYFVFGGNAFKICEP